MNDSPRVLLGHGTENDFVVLPDPDGTVWPEDRLDAALVRRLCDRRAGLGGDGVLRVVRSAHVPDAPAVLGDDLDRCEWFMDHRNADGSHAEMCGNGIRLFLHVLVSEGLLDRASCESGVLVGTRGGPRRVGATAGRRLLGRHGPRPAVRRGRGRPVRPGVPRPGRVDGQPAPGLPHRRPGRVARPDSAAPGFDAALFPDGVNVEFVNVLEAGAHIRLRVSERGVGETRSCGTGACAAAYAALAAEGMPRGRCSSTSGWPAVGADQPVDDGADRARRDRLRRRAVPGVAGRLSRVARPRRGGGRRRDSAGSVRPGRDAPGRGMRCTR